MIAKENAREIYLGDGNPSNMGPVTHIAKVPMTIGNHQELATIHVANVQNHEVILGMPWPKRHNPRIDWGKNKITFDSKRCTTWCLDKNSSVYGIPEATAWEENLITRFSEIHTQEKGLEVKKLVSEGRIPTKVSLRAAGHDLYAQEAKTIPARGQAIIGTGIAIGLPLGTYGRIAPRSGLVAKHALTINAGVIDPDYTGEIKIILVNLSNQDYEVKKGDKIDKLIVERIMDEEMVIVKELDTTERGVKGFASSDTEMNKQVGTSANLLTKSPHQNLPDTSRSETMKKKGCQGAPRPGMITQQVRTGADLLTKHSWEVTGQSGKPNSHNHSLNKKVLSEPSKDQPERGCREKPSPPMMTKQVRTGADLLTNQFQKVTRPTDRREGHNPHKRKKIRISEITQKEFRQAYRNGEATGIVKFLQKEKQIHLRKINISTELAIRNKEELRTRTKTGENLLESLVTEEYHDLLQAFEKGEKTSLPPHIPGIDLEINIEEGKGLPEQNIYPLGAEELETVQEYCHKPD